MWETTEQCHSTEMVNAFRSREAVLFVRSLDKKKQPWIASFHSGKFHYLNSASLYLCDCDFVAFIFFCTRWFLSVQIISKQANNFRQSSLHDRYFCICMRWYVYVFTFIHEKLFIEFLAFEWENFSGEINFAYTHFTNTVHECFY